MSSNAPDGPAYQFEVTKITLTGIPEHAQIVANSGSFVECQILSPEMKLIKGFSSRNDGHLIQSKERPALEKDQKIVWTIDPLSEWTARIHNGCHMSVGAHLTYELKQKTVKATATISIEIDKPQTASSSGKDLMFGGMATSSTCTGVFNITATKIIVPKPKAIPKTQAAVEPSHPSK
ncbi:hypothetical protein BD410DRAFT_790276 [Rickenella mellea]|uniref:Uncharacterized protein n=1 Tax=Rickenella mellea TaxID=50990 RepID=A0A4Y7Q0U7_9AGAM|nr:hypothetical protein BD410DRAFT_790276 [Rickenella mellea]